MHARLTAVLEEIMLASEGHFLAQPSYYQRKNQMGGVRACESPCRLALSIQEETSYTGSNG
jgi:hypothetical protein